MAIKINWKDLQKRIINGKEVEKVMLNLVQIWPEATPPVADDYLCFTAAESNCLIQLDHGQWYFLDFEYSYDKVTWNDYPRWGGTPLRLTNVWDKIYWRNKSTTPQSVWWEGYRFNLWKCYASWDVNYMLCKTSTTSVGRWGLNGLFRGCSGLLSAPRLPATTLWSECYRHMFAECTSLLVAPELPATVLASYCYASMFYNCVSLLIPPDLPATVLESGCYKFMFEWCTSLIGIPELPGTRFWEGCCVQMFSWCTSLKISDTQTWEYQIPYSIPSGLNARRSYGALDDMFANTWGTFTETPRINTTYYLSNNPTPPAPPAWSAEQVFSYNMLDKSIFRDLMIDGWDCDNWWNIDFQQEWMTANGTDVLLSHGIWDLANAYYIKAEMNLYITGIAWHWRPDIWVYLSKDTRDDSYWAQLYWDTSITYPWTYKLVYEVDMRPTVQNHEVSTFTVTSSLYDWAQLISSWELYYDISDTSLFRGFNLVDVLVNTTSYVKDIDVSVWFMTTPILVSIYDTSSEHMSGPGGDYDLYTFNVAANHEFWYQFDYDVNQWNVWLDERTYNSDGTYTIKVWISGTQPWTVSIKFISIYNPSVMDEYTI